MHASWRGVALSRFSAGGHSIGGHPVGPWCGKVPLQYGHSLTCSGICFPLSVGAGGMAQDLIRGSLGPGHAAIAVGPGLVVLGAGALLLGHTMIVAPRERAVKRWTAGFYG